MFTFISLVVSVLSSEALMFPKDISVLFVPQSRHLVNTTWKCSLGSEFQRCARRSRGDNVGEIQTYLILLEQCRFSLCTEVHGQPTHPHGGGGLMAVHSWFCVLILQLFRPTFGKHVRGLEIYAINLLSL